MRASLVVLAALVSFGAASSANAVQITDTVQAPTGFFAPGEAATFDSPYYRGAGEDWGWTHNPINAAFTSARAMRESG